MIFWTYALRQLQRRLGRSLLSLFSVVIAVAAIVAVMSATDTTRKAYQQVFATLAGRADLEVTSRGGGRLRQDVAAKIKDLSGIRAVVPTLLRGTILYAHGTKAKAMALGIVPDAPDSLADFEIVEGHLPKTAGEIAIEKNLAAGLQIKAGDSVRLLTSNGLRSYKVAGLISLESAARLRQGGMILAPLGHLQRVFRSAGEVDSLNLFLTDPKTAPDVIERVSQILPQGLSVGVPSSRTGLAEETLLLTEVSLDMASALSFTTAVFIVLSVFLMNVSERRQQLSILRAIGASRRQIMGMIGCEALLVGAIGTLVGVPVGIYGARFLTRSMATLLNADLPESTDLSFAMIVGAVVGPAICLLAAWYPARRASLVSPLEGMRPVVTVRPERGHRTMTVAGLIGLAISAVFAVASLRGHLPIWSVVFGLILSLVSLVALVPIALPPAVRLIAWPLRRFLSVEGDMAERLVLRHSGRSSLTIGVLFIAVSAGIGTSNAVFSITDDVRTWYERTITADFLLRAMMPDVSGQEAVTLDESIRDEIMALGDIQQVEAIRLLRVEAGEHDAIMLAREFSLYKQAPLDVVGGDADAVLQQLAQGEVVVGSVLAEREHIRPGEMLHITYGGMSQSFRVAAVATEYTFGGSVVYVDRLVAKRLFAIEGVDSFLIKSVPGKSAELEPKLRALAQEKGLLLQSFAELLKLIDSMVAGVTGGLWILLTLGLVVGALGVVNTLTMNVLEQTREMGMLRAIGMARGQLMKTVLGQAAIIGMLGILAGGISGVSLARSINISLATMFGHQIAFALRPQFMLALLAAALAIVMLAALAPALRAAKLSPMTAMRQD